MTFVFLFICVCSSCRMGLSILCVFRKVVDIWLQVLVKSIVLVVGGGCETFAMEFISFSYQSKSKRHHFQNKKRNTSISRQYLHEIRSNKSWSLFERKGNDFENWRVFWSAFKVLFYKWSPKICCVRVCICVCVTTMTKTCYLWENSAILKQTSS